ncbi:MAG: hypothetical protein HY898_05505 [Deltaproteobacteria bacterium]|nr:hypothetical protein [Deltaproteobacteria bacterium]
MRHILMMAGLVLVMATGCAKTGTTDTTSTVQGKFALSSYASAPTAVVALDEKGAKLQAMVAADGAFSLSLEKGHKYSLRAVVSAVEEPLVFPRTSGKLDTTFRVVGGAAVVQLGNVRHFDSAPATGFVVMSGQVAPGTTANGEVGECVDGFVKGSGAPCADDDGKEVTCEGGGEEGDNEGEAKAETDPGPDIQCNNGLDPNGQPCVGGDQDTADPQADMSVPEHNPPDAVGGCDDGDNVEENVEE